MKKLFFILFALTAFMTLAAQDSSAECEVMLTPPYLQNPGEDGMTVMWITSVPCRSWVEYGTDSTRLMRARTMDEGMMIANNTINRIRLDGLEPGMQYFYRVISQPITHYSSYRKEFGDTVRSPLYGFRTWDDSPAERTVVVYNDLHANTGLFDRLHNSVTSAGYRPDLVIFNGDCIDDPETEDKIVRTLAAYGNSYGSMTVPSMYMRGNHETRGAYSPILWNYICKSGGEHSYGAFTLGGTRFVLTDCGEDKPDTTAVYYDMNDFTGYRLEQASFLETEVASAGFRKASHRVLIHHIPIYWQTPMYNPSHEMWHPLLKDAPFDVSINGHMHRYTHIPSGVAGNNFPVIVGGGPNDESATATVLCIGKDRLDVKIINVAGEELLGLSF